MATEYKLSYTASEINAKLGKIDSLATKDEIPSKTSELTNDSGFATEVQVNEVSEQVANVSALVGDTSVSERINTAITNSVADWSQTDENAPDYIKNKPDEEDAISLVAEMNLVSPVTAEDGSIYTDENGALYSL